MSTKPVIAEPLQMLIAEVSSRLRGLQVLHAGRAITAGASTHCMPICGLAMQWLR
jgi:hypothetical protein